MKTLLYILMWLFEAKKEPYSILNWNEYNN